MDESPPRAFPWAFVFLILAAVATVTSLVAVLDLPSAYNTTNARDQTLSNSCAILAAGFSVAAAILKRR
jgi:multisubunit Na+/H+ antiporter MnhG subunit